MDYCIVVARYNEPLEWTEQFSNVIVYNKGNAFINNNYAFTEIILNNVGREGHTYYKYIYDNYDNLAEYTFFLQGCPFDHSPNIISNINNYINQINNKILNNEFIFLSERILKSNLRECTHHKGLPLIKTYETLFNEKKTDIDFKFGAGAQFIVSKTKILQRPKEFYLNIIKMLEYDINPIEGFVIERFHSFIFA